MERLSKKAMNKARETIGISKGKSKPVKKVVKKKDGENEEMNEEVESAAEEKESESETDEVSFEDKVAFTEKVRRLTNEGLTKLVKKVKELCADALEDVDAEKLHIQVDKIDKKSFDNLTKLVDENLVKSNKKK